MQGDLTLTVQKALLTHDTDFSSPDPYVKVLVGANVQCTQPSSGKTPVWTNKNVFQFRLQGENLIQVLVYDKDTFSSDDPMGDGAISVSQFTVYTFTLLIPYSISYKICH